MEFTWYNPRAHTVGSKHRKVRSESEPGTGPKSRTGTDQFGRGSDRSVQKSDFASNFSPTFSFAVPNYWLNINKNGAAEWNGNGEIHQSRLQFLFNFILNGLTRRTTGPVQSGGPVSRTWTASPVLESRTRSGKSVPIRTFPCLVDSLLCAIGCINAVGITPGVNISFGMARPKSCARKGT